MIKSSIYYIQKLKLWSWPGIDDITKVAEPIRGSLYGMRGNFCYVIVTSSKVTNIVFKLFGKNLEFCNITRIFIEG